MKATLLTVATLMVASRLWPNLAPVATAGTVGAAQLGGVARVALLSDTHLAGPEYPLNTENGPIDNASITKTQHRLYRAVQAINAISPQPELVLFGGDVVHNGLHYLSSLGLNATGLQRLSDQPVNGFKIAQQLLSELRAPPLYVWGNHDNLVTCGDLQASASKDLAARVYRHFFDAAPYDSRDVGAGWKVVALNSMYGYTWDATHPDCNALLSSYGKEQLRWLDAQLAEGKHTVVMMHFPPTTAVLSEVEVEAHKGYPDLASVLTAHSNVRLVLSGHFHKGMFWESLYPFPTHTLPAVRYNPQNFHVLDLHPDGAFQLTDLPKNRDNSRCSDWWSYEGGQARCVAPVQPRDGGDCGYPAAGEEDSFELQPVLNQTAIPSQDWFNPERACQFVLAKPFLEACAGGASQDCCDVVADATRLSSSAPFATCFCRPSFWQESVDYMRLEHDLDLTTVLGHCISDFDKTVVYRGGPLTWCPAEVPSASRR